jgi:hypothetical protein
MPQDIDIDWFFKTLAHAQLSRCPKPRGWDCGFVYEHTHPTVVHEARCDCGKCGWPDPWPQMPKGK